eukprot:297071_1
MRISQRKQTFYKFEHSEIGIICSSRVLNEGVDLPFVDTIMFVEPRRSTIDIVQCIGRGLRLHNNLKKCNILLPIYYDQLSKTSNFKNVLEILTAMIKYDKSLIQEFTKVKKEKIEMVQFNLDDDDDDQKNQEDAEEAKDAENTKDAEDEEEDEEEILDLDTINDEIFNELRTKIIAS